MPPRPKRRAPLEKRRRLRRDATVEAAVARGAGLHVRDQIEMARNASVWTGTVATAATAFFGYAAVLDTTPWALVAAALALPAAVLLRRGWMLQRSLREIDADDPVVTEGDEEMAHLRELVRSLDSRVAAKAGKTALAAAEQGFAERRRVLERRGHVEALLVEADPLISEDELAAGLALCDQELADIDRQIADLVSAVAHLASSSDQSRAAAVAHVRDAADSVKALAAGFDELTNP